MSDEERETDELSENEYEVEEIMGHREGDSQMEYLIKWKGYDSIFNSWEPEENILSAKTLVEAYFNSQKEPNGSTTKKSKRTSQAPQAKEPSTSPEYLSADENYDSNKVLQIDSDSSVDGTISPDVIAEPAKTVPTKRGRGRSPKNRKKVKAPTRIENKPASSKRKRADSSSDESDSSIDNLFSAVSRHERFKSIDSDQEFDDDYERMIVTLDGKEIMAIVDEKFQPEGDWDILARSVAGVFGPPTDTIQLTAMLLWKDGGYSLHEMSNLHSRCPQLLLKYYEDHLVFADGKMDRTEIE